jgi:hypothetical protein
VLRILGCFLHTPAANALRQISTLQLPCLQEHVLRQTPHVDRATLPNSLGGLANFAGLPARNGWDRFVRNVPGRVRLGVRRAEQRTSTGECAVDRARDVLDGRYAGGLIRVSTREDHDGVVPGRVGGGERAQTGVRSPGNGACDEDGEIRTGWWH